MPNTIAPEKVSRLKQVWTRMCAKIRERDLEIDALRSKVELALQGVNLDELQRTGFDPQVALRHGQFTAQQLRDFRPQEIWINVVYFRDGERQEIHPPVRRHLKPKEKPCLKIS